jgi:cardiolipin synthase
VTQRRWLTVPNGVTLMRLACLPLFLWLLFVRDDRASAAWLLAFLGATDWVDGWLARRLGQRSDVGEVLDPAVDRLLFIVGVGAIIIDGAVPRWFGVVVIAREAVIAVVLLVATAAGMKRFSVSRWGKNYTFALMWAFPLLLLGASGTNGAEFVRNAGWAIGVPGVVISYVTAVAYVPVIAVNLRIGRTQKRERLSPTR